MLKDLAGFGIELDEDRNATITEGRRALSHGRCSAVKVLVVPADEEIDRGPRDRSGGRRARAAAAEHGRASN